jgi:hypothetical protein
MLIIPEEFIGLLYDGFDWYMSSSSLKNVFLIIHILVFLFLFDDSHKLLIIHEECMSFKNMS